MDWLPRFGAACFVIAFLIVIGVCCAEMSLDRKRECWHGTYVGTSLGCSTVTE